jgi:hypothetical protein
MAIQSSGSEGQHNPQGVGEDVETNNSGPYPSDLHQASHYLPQEIQIQDSQSVPHEVPGAHDDETSASGDTEPLSECEEEISQSLPGEIDPFDWRNFNARYDKAMADVKEKEDLLAMEYDTLVTVLIHESHNRRHV